MSNPQIYISYNGHRTAVTCLPDQIFLVQITSTPYRVQCLANDDGSHRWIEVDDCRETLLSHTIGSLIAEARLK